MTFACIPGGQFGICDNDNCILLDANANFVTNPCGPDPTDKWAEYAEGIAQLVGESDIEHVDAYVRLW